MLAIVAACEALGLTKSERNKGSSEGFQSNGWQWDWWQEFEKDGKFYTLEGSGAHGGHRFFLSDEQ